MLLSSCLSSIFKTKSLGAYLICNDSITEDASSDGHFIVMAVYIIPMSDLVVNAIVRLHIAIAFNCNAFSCFMPVGCISSTVAPSVSGKSGCTVL
eukprot:12871327-Ditylum_brightwellii.AAC.1